MLMKFKPTYNFQAVEFEAEVNSDEDLQTAMAWYDSILSLLVKVTDANIQPKTEVKEYKPLATEKQKDIMKKYNIAFNANTTVDEAQQLIAASIAKKNAKL